MSTEVLEREQVIDREAYEQEFSDESRRYLSEVDHINRYRSRLTRIVDPVVLKGIKENLIPAVKEGAISHAVSTTYQERAGEDYMWLDQTHQDVARSGYTFHNHPEALKRVDIEVDEADDIAQNLRPGFIKVLLSPKMSRHDATYKDAQNEHLADDDMVRIHMIDQATDGTIRGKYMQSLLVRNVPLEAWVNMLADPTNIFGKSITVRDELSATAVMEVHRELELPEKTLPEGVISLVEAVLPYADPEAQKSISAQLELFRCDQQELHTKAEIIANRWLDFEVELADSLHLGSATPIIQDFLRDLADEWSTDFLKQIWTHTSTDGSIRMDRQFAVDIERSRRNTLWVKAGVITGNEDIIKQMSPQAVAAVRSNEAEIYAMIAAGRTAEEIRYKEAAGNKVAAKENIKAGGGCPGVDSGAFGGSKEEGDGVKSDDEWHGGKKFYNAKCRSCKEVKAEIGACHICEDCVHNPAKMQTAYDAEMSAPKPIKPSILEQVLSTLKPKITEKAPKEPVTQPVTVGKYALVAG
jgi:hypothetical protein